MRPIWRESLDSNLIAFECGKQAGNPMQKAELLLTRFIDRWKCHSRLYSLNISRSMASISNRASLSVCKRGGETIYLRTTLENFGNSSAWKNEAPSRLRFMSSVRALNGLNKMSRRTKRGYQVDLCPWKASRWLSVGQGTWPVDHHIWQRLRRNNHPCFFFRFY